MFVDRLPFLDAVILLNDRLDDLFSEEKVTSKTYNRRKSFRNLVRAVNKADRMISLVRKKAETVALFLPKDVHIFPFHNHDVYAGDQIDSIVASELSSLHPSAIEIFIDREPWHEVHAILSEKLSLYSEHPSESWTQAGSIRRVNSADFNADRISDKSAFFDTENRVLHLSEPLSEDRFIVFEAHTIPGLLKIRDIDAGSVKEAEGTILDSMTVKTPVLHEDLLLDVALSKLLPGQADRVSPREIELALHGAEPANGPTVVVPDGQRGGYGCEVSQ